jgi:hypothetical protein
MAAGYSGKPLIAKLGLKPGHHARIVNAPPHYRDLLAPIPPSVTFVDAAAGDLDFIHCFATQQGEVDAAFAACMPLLVPAGMLWISWPKRTATMVTDLDEHAVRAIGLRHGLVDVKVCAVDAVWSGLKFVRRLKDRH